MTTLVPDDGPDAAKKSMPLPYTVTDLETFDFGNKIEGVPEIGRSVSVSELANYVKDREHRSQGDDRFVRIGGHTLGYNYSPKRNETNLIINGKAVPQIWDTHGDTIVFYPERVIVRTSKGIVVNPHTLAVNKDSGLDRRTFDVTKDVRDHVTNENTVAFISNGEIYTQPIDKSAEPTLLVTPGVVVEGGIRMLGITENNTVFYTMRLENGHTGVYRNDARVGDMPDFDTLEKHVFLPDGKLILQFMLESGIQMTKQIDTNGEPRYRINGTDTAIGNARRATARVLQRVGTLQGQLSDQAQAIGTKDAELQAAQATIAQMQSEIAHMSQANTDLQRQVTDKNGEIATLTRRGTESAATIDGLNGKINGLTKTIGLLQIRFEGLKMRSVVGGISTDDFLAIKGMVGDLHSKSTAK